MPFIPHSLMAHYAPLWIGQELHIFAGQQLCVRAPFRAMLTCLTSTRGMACMPQNLDWHHTAKQAGRCSLVDSRTS